MTPPTVQKEAFTRVVIDTQLKDVGWDMTDGHSVRYAGFQYHCHRCFRKTDLYNDAKMCSPLRLRGGG